MLKSQFKRLCTLFSALTLCLCLTIPLVTAHGSIHPLTGNGNGEISQPQDDDLGYNYKKM